MPGKLISKPRDFVIQGSRHTFIKYVLTCEDLHCTKRIRKSLNKLRMQLNLLTLLYLDNVIYQSGCTSWLLIDLEVVSSLLNILETVNTVLYSSFSTKNRDKLLLFADKLHKAHAEAANVNSKRGSRVKIKKTLKDSSKNIRKKEKCS
jgi:hypothetical protein